MRLLLFSDLHANLQAASRIVAFSQSVDVVVGAGDFGNVRRRTSDCIEALRDIRVPSFLVPGNNESFEELREACKAWDSATVLHGTDTEFAGVHIFGVGGGIPLTPFGSWSYDFSEEEGRQLFSTCPSDAILISHSPPKGVVDVSSSGQHFGSEEVRSAVIRLTPRLVICGHIHESARQHALLGRTPVINAGPAGIQWTL